MDEIAGRLSEVVTQLREIRRTWPLKSAQKEHLGNVLIDAEKALELYEAKEEERWKHV